MDSGQIKKSISVGISLGDPAGIGPETTVNALLKKDYKDIRFFIPFHLSFLKNYSNFDLLLKKSKILPVDFSLEKFNFLNPGIYLFPLKNLPDLPDFGVPSKEGGIISYEFLKIIFKG